MGSTFKSLDCWLGFCNFFLLLLLHLFSLAELSDVSEDEGRGCVRKSVLFIQMLKVTKVENRMKSLENLETTKPRKFI